ncbi:MAG: twin-arginine translocation pathway signal protein [Robiginitomaculum sp.]|nr:MAG: twin-arginine translocation pathway signal protein [Robiginitomaculum sp.]
MFLNSDGSFRETHATSSSQPTQSPITNLSRRHFLGGSGTMVIGMTLFGACAPAKDSFPEIEANNGPSPLTDVEGGDATPSLFITIENDGNIKLICHRSEMGQQTWTAMAQIVADEMEADWDKIEIVQAVGDKKYGSQNTDGSTSVRNNFHRLRITGAAMRSMLESAAAQLWQVDKAECKAKLGVVYHSKSKKSAHFGELAAFASKLAVPAEDEITLKTREEWRYIGQATKSLTVPKIVRGQGTYGMDVQLPDMLYAVIAHPPQVKSFIKSVDTEATLAVQGVKQTFQLPKASTPVGFKPLGGIAVIATDTWAAIQGRKALEISWTDGPNAGFSSEVFAKELRATARKSGTVKRKKGDVNAALAKADKTLNAEYYAAFLSQSPMEPPCATARWDGDKVECWTCTQNPQAAQKTVANVCKVPEENVTIHVTWLGGGFGRKSKPDYVAEAALIAREIGKPVKVVWTREDDLQHGYFHSVSAQFLEAGLDENGQCTSWLHRTVFPTITSTFVPLVARGSDMEVGLGATDMPFAIANVQVEVGKAKAPIRIGWLRSVCNVFQAFAVQSFSAELAHAAGIDQKDYLLKLFGDARHFDPNKEGAKYSNYGASLEKHPIDTARLSHVTKVAAKMANWGRKLPEGHGIGIATHRSFLTYVSTVIEVKVSAEGDLEIIGVWSAIDAGTVVNTGHTISQVEGGTLYGLSNALYGEITVKDGIVEQANFPDWRVMRMSEAPKNFEVKIIKSDAPPGGVGEPPTPPAAPALANAIFAATGVRLRSLPLIPKGQDQLPL